MATPYFAIPASCPHCECLLELLATGVADARTFSTGVLKCTGCRREFQVTVTLRPAPTPGADRQRRYRPNVRTRDLATA